MKDSCCRSINFKTIITARNEENCEILHNLVYNTSDDLLKKNDTYDHIYFNSPMKVKPFIISMTKVRDSTQTNNGGKVHQQKELIKRDSRKNAVLCTNKSPKFWFIEEILFSTSGLRRIKTFSNLQPLSCLIL